MQTQIQLMRFDKYQINPRDGILLLQVNDQCDKLAADRRRYCQPVAAIQVVQCTRAHDPWGPTSEDKIAIF